MKGEAGSGLRILILPGLLKVIIDKILYLTFQVVGMSDFDKRGKV